MTGPIAARLAAILIQRPGGRNPRRTAPATPATAPWVDELDARLLVEISGGDLTALAKLYDRHAPACWAMAMRLTADENSATAAVETAFLDVWREPPLHAADRLGPHLTELTRRCARQ